MSSDTSEKMSDGLHLDEFEGLLAQLKSLNFEDFRDSSGNILLTNIAAQIFDNYCHEVAVYIQLIEMMQPIRSRQVAANIIAECVRIYVLNEWVGDE